MLENLEILKREVFRGQKNTDYKLPICKLFCCVQKFRTRWVIFLRLLLNIYKIYCLKRQKGDKKMKRKEILRKETGKIGGITILLITIGIILLITAIVSVNNKNKLAQTKKSNQEQTSVVDTARPSIEGDKYVAESNGIKVNTRFDFLTRTILITTK